ncbi:MAG: hypothetical protein HGA31_06930 [Candidatus Moranbacteria bacterium]|nr:hypothetical protein [Candidatus Moranbacteria bacterium]
MHKTAERNRSVMTSGLRVIAVLELVCAAFIVLFAYRVPVLRSDMSASFIFASCYVLISLLTRATWQYLFSDFGSYSRATTLILLVVSSMSLTVPLLSVWMMRYFLTWLFGGRYPSDPSMLKYVLGWYTGTMLTCGLALSLSVLAFLWCAFLFRTVSGDSNA